MNQLSRILGRAFAGRRFYNHRDLEKVESPEPRCSHLFSPLRRFLGRIGEPVAMDDNTLNNPFETTDNRGRNTMGLLQQSTVSSRALAVVLGVLLVVSVPAAWPIVAADDQSSLGAGVYPGYAITGAKIVTAPGKSIDAGTIVIRHGIIEAVGPAKDVEVPYDAETIDGKGLVVYPGFIDLYTTIGQRAGTERSATGKGRLVDLAEAPSISTPPDNRKGLTPEFDVASALELTEALAEPRRRLGFTDLLSAPSGSIATGQSAACEPERLASPRSDHGRADCAACAHIAPLGTGDGGWTGDTSGSRSDSRPRPWPATRPRSGRSRRKPVPPRLDGLRRPLPAGHARRRALPETQRLF